MQFQNISKIWAVKFIFQCHITIVLTVAGNALAAVEFILVFATRFFFTTNHIVFQNDIADIAAGAAPNILHMVRVSLNCITNTPLLAKPRASGIMYIIGLNHSPFFTKIIYKI